jgi:hypothetical protein
MATKSGTTHSKLELMDKKHGCEPWPVHIFTARTRRVVAHALSVAADLGGGHGDADGRVLLLCLGATLLGLIRRRVAGAADGRHGRSRRREHHGAAPIGRRPGLLLGRRLLALHLRGPGNHEAPAARRSDRAAVSHRHGGKGRHHGD